MNTIDLIVLSRDQYTVLCLTTGFGWGLWVMTLVAAITIDGIKWRRWVNGQ